MQVYRVLTIRQPWATAIMLGLKTWELRGWSPGRFPKPFLVHAANTPYAEVYTALQREPELAAALAEQTYDTPSTFPRQMILGAVAVRDVVVRHPGALWLDRSFTAQIPGYWAAPTAKYAWELCAPRHLTIPIGPIKGHLGFWEFIATNSLTFS